MRPAELDQAPAAAFQLFVLLPPGEGLPVLRVPAPGEPGFISVIHCRSPGKGHLPGPEESVERPGLFRFIPGFQQSPEPLHVMAPQKVQHGVQILPGIVLHLLPVPAVRSLGVRFPQGKIQHQVPEHIVHHAVQFPPGQVLALDSVALLVGGVFPHFPDKGRIRLLCLQFLVETGKEPVGQFVGHIQPPAADPGIQPVMEHAVFVPDDEIQVGRLRFRHFRQGSVPPPAAIVFRIFPEMVPLVIGRSGSLPGAQALIGPGPVEVPAVGPGVAEHPVQEDPHPMAPCFPAQDPEGFFRTQEGIDGLVVPSIVPVVAPGLENGVQVQTVHPQFFQIGKLFQDSLQGASVEVVVGHLALFVLYIAGIPFPGAVDQGSRLSLEPVRRHLSPAKPVRTNLDKSAQL